jgi:hypothetical protein
MDLNSGLMHQIGVTFLPITDGNICEKRLAKGKAGTLPKGLRHCCVWSYSATTDAFCALSGRRFQ